MAIVRPEYGPTLGELVVPRWRALGRAGKAAAALAALVVVAAVVVAVRGSGDDLEDLIRSKPFAMSLGYNPALHEVAPHPGEVVRLETSPQRPDHQVFVVRALRLAPYRGDVSAALMTASSTMVHHMHEADPAFLYRGEGRVRINKLPGYQISFTTKQDGHTVYGKRVLLVKDDPGAREGADITMLAERSAAVGNVDAVGANGLLKAPYRSFRLSTDRTA
jgi:hypothetical protein